jgi:hypothetical protein
MAITDSSSFDLMVATAVTMGLNKNNFTSKGAASYHSLWKVAGSGGAGGNPPVGAGAICDKNTLGALPLLSVSGQIKLYLANLGLSSTNSGTCFIGDRLWANSGLSGISTIAQPINAPALPRATSGEGLLLCVEIYTATGSTAQNLTVTYTASDGTTGRTATTSLIASPVAGQIIPLFLPDRGLSLINPIQSVILAGSTLTQGDFGLTIIKPVAALPLITNIFNSMGVYDLPVIELDQNACLFPYYLCSTASMGNTIGSISLGRG